jgi:hypothetical protein
MDPHQFESLVDSAVMSEPGSVFYSGRGAFSEPSDLYILGLNPGGAPTDLAEDTIGRNLKNWKTLPEYWSAYRDDAWEGCKAGEYGMQPRVRHMFDKLGRDLQKTPASNVVFVRSRNEYDLAKRKAELLELCWPVHDAVIKRLGIRSILCFGSTAGAWTRQALGADIELGIFKEFNRRGWTSTAHTTQGGICVVTLTHPSRADWRNPEADPTPLVRQALAR